MVAATDGYVQVSPDSSGKKVDTQEITRSDASVVERQRVQLPGPTLVDSEFLRLILIELRIHSILLAQAFNVNDDLNQMRSDISTTDDLSF